MNTPKLDFKAINATALPYLESILDTLSPKRERSGNAWLILNPTRPDRNLGSFKVQADGRWFENTTGDKGGDLISLWAYCHGVDQASAAREIQAQFCPGGTPADPAKPWTGPKPSAEWIPMHEAGEPQAPKGKPSAVWTYRDAEGRALFQRPRYDMPEGKIVAWWSAWRLPDGQVEWKKSAPPTPRPLYGLEHLQDGERDAVLVVEGEKAADAAQALFPRLAVVTSGGVHSASASDWTPLKGRQVFLWPDHDAPGLEYAGEVAAALRGHGVRLQVVAVPKSWPEKWDLADRTPDGTTPADLQVMIDQAQPWDGQELEAPKPNRALDVVRWSELKDKPIPAVEWIWEPFFPRIAFGVLASHPGHGKSMLALAITVSVATGLPLFGAETCGPAGAGMLSLEDDVNVIHRRLKAIRDSYGSEWTSRHDELMDANLRILVKARAPLEALEAAAAAHTLAGLAGELGEAMRTTQAPPAVLFLDTLNAVHDGDEQSNTDTRPLAAMVSALSGSLGCSIWALHHLRKAGSGKSAPALTDRMDPELVRGASALVGSVRGVVQFGWILPAEAYKANLEQTNSHRRYAILGLTKVNDGPLSPWLLLEHTDRAGIWAPTPNGDEALAALRGNKAVEELNQAETLLLEIHRQGDDLDRKALAEKFWPGRQDAGSKLKNALADLRRRHNWIQKGSTKLTIQGLQKAQELGRQTEEDANPYEAEDEQFRASA